MKQLFIVIYCIQVLYLVLASQILHVGPPQPDACSTDGCPSQDQYDSIKFIHSQLDDDANGDIDITETDEFLRDELQYENGNDRKKGFHKHDKHISLDELWQAWLTSEVHNWTVEQTVNWLITSVELPQYAKNFEDHGVNGTLLPKLATNNGPFMTSILGIKDAIHKHKIVLKAMDAVLFGPSKADRNFLKDAAIVFLLVFAIGGCWFAYVQHRYSQSHQRKMMADMEALQKAEDSLMEMQKELDKARQEQKNADVEKRRLEKRLKHENSKDKMDNVDALTEDECFNQIRILEHQVETLQDELERTEQILEQHQSQWMPPPSLQLWLQLTYEVEFKNYSMKKNAAEKQLSLAKEACDKLRKKKTQMFGSFRIAHGSSMDDVDEKIFEAKTALAEVTQDFKERSKRWQQIEHLCGFSIVQNPGLSYLQSVLYGSLDSKKKFINSARALLTRNDSSDALLDDDLSPSAGSLARDLTFPLSLHAPSHQSSPSEPAQLPDMANSTSSLHNKRSVTIEQIVETNNDSSNDAVSLAASSVTSKELNSKPVFSIGSPTDLGDTSTPQPITSTSIVSDATEKKSEIRAPNSRQSSSDSFNPPPSSHETSVSPPSDSATRKNKISLLFKNKSGSNPNLGNPSTPDDCSTDSGSVNEEIKHKKKRLFLPLKKSKAKLT